MEEARLLLPVPEPVPHGCVGACLNESDADEWRGADPARYCDWVAAATVDPTAPVAGAWKVWPGVVWSTGLPFEHIMARLRRAALVLRSDDVTADEASAAHADLLAAETISSAWRTDGELFEHLPELSPPGLAALARVAWAVAHALAIAGVADHAARAGLWRSLARALATDITIATETRSRGAVALRAAALYAECETLRQSAIAHFEACRAGAARACAARAVERARAAHQDDAVLVNARRVEVRNGSAIALEAPDAPHSRCCSSSLTASMRWRSAWTAARRPGGYLTRRCCARALSCPCFNA
jgi:hypothetical protein